MGISDTERLGAILGRDATLADLCQRGLNIQRLDKKLKGRIDPGLQDYFELANIRGDVAVLMADSPAWAARLRYQVPLILAACQALGLDSVKTIQIKVRQTFVEPPDGSPR